MVENKINKVMHEFASGKLHSGSKKGPEVKSKKQALAIGYSEAHKSSHEKALNTLDKLVKRKSDKKFHVYDYKTGKKVSRGFSTESDAHKHKSEMHKAHTDSGDKMGFPLKYIK